MTVKPAVFGANAVPPSFAVAGTAPCHAPFGGPAASGPVTFTVYVQSAAFSPDGSQAADTHPPTRQPLWRQATAGRSREAIMAGSPYLTRS